MSDVERRLDKAAEETRQAARHVVPPPIEAHRRVPTGWVVFAAAFATVVIAIGVLPLLTRPADQPVSGSTLPDIEAPSTVAEPTSTTTIDVSCSASGLTLPTAQDGLPAPVAQARESIAAAAASCDYGALRELAGPDLVTSFGGGDFEHLVELEEDGRDQPLSLLVRLFELPYASQDIEGVRYFIWPSAFIYDTWEAIPAADLEALRSVYSEEELDDIAAFGAYAGWRIGLTSDGDWKYFVAGD